MANAIKRMNKAKNKGFQAMCEYYMYQKAGVIFSQETPDADDLLLAKALWANQVKIEDMARNVVTNTSIGAAIDSGNDPLESDIEWCISNDDSADAQMFSKLAQSYKAAGLIGA